MCFTFKNMFLCRSLRNPAENDPVKAPRHMGVKIYPHLLRSLLYLYTDRAQKIYNNSLFTLTALKETEYPTIEFLYTSPSEHEPEIPIARMPQ